MAEQPEKSRAQGTEQTESRYPEVERLLGSHFEGVPHCRPLIVRAWRHQSGVAQLETYRVGFPREWDRRVVSGLSPRPWDLLWRIRH